MKLHILAICGVFAIASFALAGDKSLRIENRRDVALSELTIIAKDGAAQQTFLLAKNLAAGGTTTKSVPPTFGRKSTRSMPVVAFGPNR